VVKIGDDVLEVSGYGSYMLNGVSAAELPFLLADRYLVTQHSEDMKNYKFVIQVNERESIIVSCFKDLVAVKFENATSFTFGDTVGLMGDYENGKMVGRDGTVIDDPTTFGNDWQVLDTEPKLFQVVDRAPQYPEKCMPPTIGASDHLRRRLQATVSKEEAEEACAGYQGQAEFNMCVFDVMAAGDLELAQAGVF